MSGSFTEEGYEMEYTIPEITREKVDELRQRIKPVAKFAKGADGLFRDSRGLLHYIKPTTDPVTQSYYWEPVAGEKCKKLKPLKQIVTHHGTGGFFFKPSEAEVLAQIPEMLLGEVVAYEIVSAHITDERDDSIATIQLYSS